MSIKALSRRTRVAEFTIQRILMGCNTSLCTLAELGAYFNVPVAYFLTDDGAQ